MLSERFQYRLVNLLVPRNNQRDVLACEVFLSGLVAYRSGSLALEIVSHGDERGFRLRGDAEAVDTAIQQLLLAYPQCEVEDIAEDDFTEASTGNLVCAAIELRLREAMYLPLRSAVMHEGRSTYDDLARAADPMIGLLAALSGLHSDELGLIQFALSPLPEDWSKYWRGELDQLRERMQGSSQSLIASVLSGLGVMCGGIGVVAIAFAVALKLGILVWLLGFGLIALGLGLAWWRLRLPSPPDPNLIRNKINQSAFRVQARVFIYARDLATAQLYVDRVCGALRAYNLAGGNGFTHIAIVDANPSEISVPEPSKWLRLFGGLSLSATKQVPILNVSELAALWHLPHANAGLQGLTYTNSKRVAPLQREVAEGVWVGHSQAQGRRVEVHLSTAMLKGNIGLIAKTQSGKSNLMAILASEVMANDPDATVIVIDPHRSLAQKVAALVPPNRVDRAVYWALDDRERPFGLNLIDRMPQQSTTSLRSIAGASALFVDKRVSDVIDAFNEIWPNNWGPRMEDYLRGPLLTMATVNEGLVAEYAFEEWQLGAHAAFIANKEQILRGKLDAYARRMIDETANTFAGLRPPQRASRASLYAQLLLHYDAYASANRAMTEGEAQAYTLWLQLVHQIYTVLCIEHPPNRKGERGAGLAARIYTTADGLQRPLQYTLLDVNPMLSSPQMRLTALGGLQNAHHQHIKDWWTDSFEAYLKLNPRLLMDMVTPVRTKMNRFRASDIARRIFGQPESTIDLPHLINTGGILIVDLAAGVIGQETAALIGSAIINWVASIVFARQDDRGRETGDGVGRHQSPLSRRIFLVIDEFQSIPGADYAFMLSELGKYGVQLCLGTQSLGLLDAVNEKTRRAWLDNTSSLFVFRSGAEDARLLASELSVSDDDHLTISASDIVGLPDYACFARVRGVSAPFRVDTRKVEEGDSAVFNRICERSREVHGRDATWVDAWLQQASALQGATESLMPMVRGRAMQVPRLTEDDSTYGDFAESLQEQE